MPSGKLKATEQSHLDARFAAPESTLVVLNYSVGNFKQQLQRGEFQTKNLNFEKTI